MRPMSLAVLLLSLWPSPSFADSFLCAGAPAHARYAAAEAAAKIAKHAVHEGLTVRQATIDLGYVDGEKLTMEQLDKALDVLSMTSPGL